MNEAEARAKLEAALIECAPFLAPRTCTIHDTDTEECDDDCQTVPTGTDWFPRDWVLVSGWQQLDPDKADTDWLKVITKQASSNWAIGGMLHMAAGLYT